MYKNTKKKYLNLKNMAIKIKYKAIFYESIDWME